MSLKVHDSVLVNVLLWRAGVSPKPAVGLGPCVHGLSTESPLNPSEASEMLLKLQHLQLHQTPGNVPTRLESTNQSPTTSVKTRPRFERNSPSMQDTSCNKMLLFFPLSWAERQRCRAQHMTATTAWGIRTISSPLEKLQRRPEWLLSSATQPNANQLAAVVTSSSL